MSCHMRKRPFGNFYQKWDFLIKAKMSLSWTKYKTTSKNLLPFPRCHSFASGHTLSVTAGRSCGRPFLENRLAGLKALSHLTTQIPYELPNSNTRLIARLIKMRNISSKNYLCCTHSCTTPQTQSINTFSLLPNPLVHTTYASPASWFSHEYAPLSTYIPNSWNSAVLWNSLPHSLQLITNQAHFCKSLSHRWKEHQYKPFFHIPIPPPPLQ